MDTNDEPPDDDTPNTPVGSTTATAQPAPPYDGPNDKVSVVQAIIERRCTTREAADILGTSTGSVRKLVSRERARQAGETTTESETRATSAKHAHPQSPTLSRLVSPPIIDTEADGESTENQQFNPETPSETTDATGSPSGSLQPLQHAPRDTESGERDTANDGETIERDNPQEPSETLQVRVGRANLQRANRERSERAAQKAKDDEGSFEREELETLGNLHRTMTRNLRLAENGKDAQAWSVALGNVLDFRRRAAGKSCTLVKEQTAKASSVRNSIVFIGNQQTADAPSKPKAAKLQPAIDVESLNDQPPAISAAMDKAPDYVRSL